MQHFMVLADKFQSKNCGCRRVAASLVFLEIHYKIAEREKLILEKYRRIETKKFIGILQEQMRLVEVTEAGVTNHFAFQRSVSE